MKTCFKCQQVKPLDEFYAHPRMGDGRLNKCIACTCADSARRRAKKLKDLGWVEKETERCRKKQALARSEGRVAPISSADRAETLRRHAQKYPKKHSARLMLSNAVRDGKITRMPCVVCGSPDSEGHHDNYDKPLDVVWLCPKHHAERHVLLRKQERVLEKILEDLP